MKRSIELDTEITGLAHDGRGVAHVDGKALFVAGALPGETVRVQLIRRRRRYDEARLLAVLVRSSERVEPRCPHYAICGGCSLQHLSPAGQIQAKQQVLRDNLRRIGKVEPQRWLEPLTGPLWNYRRRGRLSVRYVPKKGRILVGFREKSNPRYVADINSCEVIHPRLGGALERIAQLLAELDAGRRIAQIEFAAGDHTVALVFRHLEPLGEPDRARLIAFARDENFAVYLQPGGVDSVHPLWPEEPELAFRFDQGALKMRFAPLDFIQVNAAMNERMLAQALRLLDLDPRDAVLDLFCGLGNFTLPLARRAARVVGVEGEAGLVDRARANACANGLDNVAFHTADLFAGHSDSDWARHAWDKILIDPPRAGAREVLEYLPAATTRRVVYVSCHPASLARDAAILVNRHGLRLTAAGIMDMFPHTSHVESIALFDRVPHGA